MTGERHLDRPAPSTTGQGRHRARGQKGSYTEGVAFELMSFLFVLVLGVGTSIAVARLYGIVVIGEYALVYGALIALIIFSSVREQAAFVRRIAVLQPRDPQVTGLWLATFCFSVALTIPIAGVVLGVTWILFHGPIGRPDLFVPAAVMVGFGVVVYNTAWNLDRILTGFRAGRALLWLRVGQSLLTAAFSIAGGIIWGTTMALVLAEVLSWLPIFVWRLVVIRRYMMFVVPWTEIRAGFRALPDIVGFGLKLTPGTLSEAALSEAGVWVVGLLAPIGTVGAYSRMWQLARRMLDLRARVGEMLFPTLVERREHGDLAGADRALIDTVRYVLNGLMLVAAAGGGAALGVTALFGAGFDEGATALALLLLVAPLAIVSHVQFQAMWALNRPMTSSAIAILRMAIGLPLMVVLTWKFGITGTALGQLVGYLVGFVVISVWTVRALSQPLLTLFSLRQMAGIAVGYAAGSTAAHVVDGQVGGPGGLVLALTAGSVAYAVALLVVGGIAPRDRERARKVLRRVVPARGRSAAPALEVQA